VILTKLGGGFHKGKNGKKHKYGTEGKKVCVAGGSIADRRGQKKKCQRRKRQGTDEFVKLLSGEERVKCRDVGNAPGESNTAEPRRTEQAEEKIKTVGTPK